MADSTIDYNKRPSTGRWPTEWPQLTAEDINKGHFYARGRKGGKRWIDRNCACLIGWAQNMCRDQCIRGRIVSRIDQLIVEQYGSCTPGPTLWNDDPKTSKAQIAKLWNDVGESFGYVED